jgi:O-antigen/teichoic acid export membrane protein
VSASALITFITQFGITYSIPRFLPTAKNRTEMINTMLTAVLLATALGSLIFLALPYSRRFWVLGGVVAFGIMFVASTTLQAGQTVLSTALVADRASDKLAKWGMIPNLARLGSPPVLASFGGFGTFTARVSADFVAFATFGMLLARGGHRFRLKMDVATAKELTKSSSGMYVAGIIGGLPQLLLPLIILPKIGSNQFADWSIALSIGALLFSMPGMVTQALLPEVALRPTERRSLLRRSSYLITVLVVPALIIGYVLAPFGLAIFGKNIASGTLVPLRWLIVAGFITMLNYVTGAILFIAKKSRMITIVNVVDAVLVLGLVFAWATNTTQVAIAWTIGDVGNTVLFGLFAYIAMREVGWRWEDLGGPIATEVEPEPAAAPASVTATGQMRALGVLFTLADQQRTVDTYYRPYQNNSLTSTTGLFSLVALRAAELHRQHSIDGSGHAPGDGPPPPASPVSAASLVPAASPMPPTRPVRATVPGAPDDSAAGQQQALAVLFKMAERQRTAGPVETDRHPPRDRSRPPRNNE